MSAPLSVDIVLDPKSAALVAEMKDIACSLRAPCAPHGPDILDIARPDGYRCDGRHYFFGYRNVEAQQAAHERIWSRIEEMRAADRAKPHWLVVTNLPEEPSRRWLTIAVGRFPFANGESAPEQAFELASGRKLYDPAFGFDTESEVQAAICRIIGCPEYRSDMELVRASCRRCPEDAQEAK